MLEETKKPYSDLEYLGGADRYVDEILEIIDKIRLFEDFTVEEISALSRHMSCYAAPRDYQLLSEGENGDYLLLILTGSVEIFKSIDNQTVQKIAEATAGATIGEMSMIDGLTRSASCVTTTPTDFALLSRQAVNEILVYMPRVGNKLLLVLLQMLAARLRETNTLLLPESGQANI